MFIDASAIVAILNDAPGADSLLAAIEAHPHKIIVSPVVRFEAIAALAASRSASEQVPPDALARAKEAIDAFLREIEAAEVAILATVAEKALTAAADYGFIVGHPAGLDTGDCFAYAVAKAYRMPILFYGGGFDQTDLQNAAGL